MIPINPEAIGDPNQTPVVYLGEENGRALGIPQRTDWRTKPCINCPHLGDDHEAGECWAEVNGGQCPCNWLEFDPAHLTVEENSHDAR
jgi:hypothetical protein